MWGFTGCGKTRWVWVSGYKSTPQRLKPINFVGSMGTTEVAPFQNRWSAEFFRGLFSH